MKTLLISLALVSLSAMASAQSFTEVSLIRNGAADNLKFIVAREANVRYYLLEGSRDSLHFDTLARIASRGNSVLPQTYAASHYDTTYGYYRFIQVDMTLGGTYSDCIAAKKSSPVITVPQPEQHEITTTSAPCTAMSAVCGQ